MQYSINIRAIGPVQTGNQSVDADALVRIFSTLLLTSGHEVLESSVSLEAGSVVTGPTPSQVGAPNLSVSGSVLTVTLPSFALEPGVTYALKSSDDNFASAGVVLAEGVTPSQELAVTLDTNPDQFYAVVASNKFNSAIGAVATIP